MRDLALATVGLAMLVGCAGQQQGTRLVLTGDPRGESVYQFRQTLFRPGPDGPEFIGWGQVPYFNDPLARNYDPRWSRTGFVTFRIHATPKPAGDYDIMILGPSGAIGPGDSEVLSGSGPAVPFETTDGTRRVDVSGIPMRSRNHPNTSFQLSGSIIGTIADDAQFDRELRQFEQELSWRGP